LTGYIHYHLIMSFTGKCLHKVIRLDEMIPWWTSHCVD